MSNHAKFITAIPTAAALFGGLFMPTNETEIPKVIASTLSYEIQDIASNSNAVTQYSISDEAEEDINNIRTIKNFAFNLLDNIEDLDPDFSKAIDDNYWDLV